jgi:hypothetical protein
MENRNQSERYSEEPKREIEKDFLKNLNSKSVFQKMVTVTYNNTFPTYTKEEIEKIMKSVTSKKDRDEADIYIYSYNALLLYGKILLSVKEKYKAEAARLTSLISILQSYENMTQTLEAAHIDGLINTDGDKPSILSLQYGSLKIDKNGKVSLDIDGKGNLYSMLQEESKEVKAKLSYLKSFVETVSDFAICYKGFCMYYLLPLFLEQILDYPDYIPEQNDKSKERFFQFRLKQRKEKGEIITDEERKWIFYPDYNEIRRDKDGDRSALTTLKDCFKLWNLTEIVKEIKAKY